MAEAKNVSFSVAEKKIVLKALNGLYASVLRARTKSEVGSDEYELYDKRLREIQALTNKEI